MNICEQVFSVLLGIYIEVKMLECIVILCLTFSGIAKLLSKASACLHLHRQFMRVLISPHPHQYLLGLFLITANSHPSGCKLVSHSILDLPFPND